MCVIKRMFAALDECYPPGHQLRPLFIRHIVRAGYRSLANMKKLVTVHNTKRMKEHNKNILHEQENLNLPPPEPRRTRAQAAVAADLIPDVMLPAGPAPRPGHYQSSPAPTGPRTYTDTAPAWTRPCTATTAAPESQLETIKSKLRQGTETEKFALEIRETTFLRQEMQHFNSNLFNFFFCE